MERALGGGEDLYPEAVEQGARAVAVGHERLPDEVVDGVGALRVELLADAEHLAQDPVEPQLRGRAAEQVIMFGEQAPCRSRIGFDPSAVCGWNAKSLQRDA